MSDVSERLSELAVSDRGFVFDPQTGATFSVNATGLAILRGLQDGLDRAALKAHLEAGFDLREGDLLRDVDEFVGVLRREGLLPRDFHL